MKKKKSKDAYKLKDAYKVREIDRLVQERELERELKWLDDIDYELYLAIQETYWIENILMRNWIHRTFRQILYIVSIPLCWYTVYKVWLDYQLEVYFTKLVFIGSWIIILIPFLNFLLGIMAGSYLGRSSITKWITRNILVLAIYSSFLLYKIVFLGTNVYLTLGTWFEVSVLKVDWGFLFDMLSVIMLVVITTISFVIHRYSIYYMSKDPHTCRFMAYLSLFTGFMLLLVLGDNFVVMFSGWEGVGICSYLLISYWFTRGQANQAALKALLINRVGDLGLLLAIFFLIYITNTVNYDIIFSIIPYLTLLKVKSINIYVIDIISGLLLFGAIGKSAQIGLHVWLPDAMEGPTPVSALIHAATMVTAGIYLIIRCSLIFEYAPTVLMIMTFLGAITAFFAATIGLIQNDIKKVIAYSTCSQLGYMLMSCGLSNYASSFFHLTTHAYFKALLFLTAGGIIHSVYNEQDIRKLGGLRLLLPVCYIYFLIGSLSLIGFPFFSGFYSKESILEMAYVKYNSTGNIVYIVGTIAAFLTAYYTFRLLQLVFLSNVNINKNIVFKIHEIPRYVALVLLILVFCSIFLGYISKDLFLGLGSPAFNNVIFILPKNVSNTFEFIPFYIKLIPLICSLLGLFLGLIFNGNYLDRYIIVSKYLLYIKYRFLKLYVYLYRAWYLDYYYNKVGSIVMSFSLINVYKLIDKSLLEILGPQKILSKYSTWSVILHKYHKLNFFNLGCLFFYGFLVWMVIFKILIGF